MRQRGLQEADSRDVTQQVVLAVTQSVERWQPDGLDASFRGLLFAIARKLALKFVQRGKLPIGTARRGAGRSDMLKLLDSLPDRRVSRTDVARTTFGLRVAPARALFRWKYRDLEPIGLFDSISRGVWA